MRTASVSASALSGLTGSTTTTWSDQLAVTPDGAGKMTRCVRRYPSRLLLRASAFAGQSHSPRRAARAVLSMHLGGAADRQHASAALPHSSARGGRRRRLAPVL